LSGERRGEASRVPIEIMREAVYGLLILNGARQLLPFWHWWQSAKSLPEQFQMYPLASPNSKVKPVTMAKTGKCRQSRWEFIGRHSRFFARFFQPTVLHLRLTILSAARVQFMTVFRIPRCLVTSIAAAIYSTRLQPSSMKAMVLYSLIVRHARFSFLAFQNYTREIWLISSPRIS
jgi:hypothetical protein